MSEEKSYVTNARQNESYLTNSRQKEENKRLAQSPLEREIESNMIRSNMSKRKIKRLLPILLEKEMTKMEMDLMKPWQGY